MSVPSEVLKDLLKSNWLEANVVQPEIVDVNLSTEAIGRYNFRTKDYAFILAGREGEVETYRNVAYADNSFGIDIQIVTANSRERLYELRSEIRRILRVKRLTPGTPDYQLIRYLGFNEAVLEELNVWKGTIRARFEVVGLYVSKGWE